MFFQQTLMSVQVSRVRTEHRVLISSTLTSAVVSLDSTEPFVTKVGMFRHKNSLYMLINCIPMILLSTDISINQKTLDLF